MTDHYDVIIVGSGAGGGTLAHRLAPSGKRISGKSAAFNWATGTRVYGPCCLPFTSWCSAQCGHGSSAGHHSRPPM